MFDIIIRDCKIIDGTGKVIDASYLVGTPGFIDPHKYSGLMNLVTNDCLRLEYVIINGKIVMGKGKHTGTLPGESLKMHTYLGK